jgi:hypothetical protein
MRHIGIRENCLVQDGKELDAVLPALLAVARSQVAIHRRSFLQAACRAQHAQQQWEDAATSLAQEYEELRAQERLLTGERVSAPRESPIVLGMALARCDGGSAVGWGRAS